LLYYLNPEPPTAIVQSSVATRPGNQANSWNVKESCQGNHGNVMKTPAEEKKTKRCGKKNNPHSFKLKCNMDRLKLSGKFEGSGQCQGTRISKFGGIHMPTGKVSHFFP